MKNRKIVVVAFLLCAALLLSVGYASITRVLLVDGKGTAAANEADFDVAFQSVTSTEFTLSDGSTPAASAYTIKLNDGDTTNRTIDLYLNDTLKVVGDQVVVKAVIENNSESYKAALGTPTVAYTNGGYFTVNAVLAADELDATDETAGSGDDSTVLTITVTLTQLPTSGSIASTFRISINAESVALGA